MFVEDTENTVEDVGDSLTSGVRKLYCLPEMASKKSMIPH